jgi:hypothetical protein
VGCRLLAPDLKQSVVVTLVETPTVQNLLVDLRTKEELDGTLPLIIMVISATWTTFSVSGFVIAPRMLMLPNLLASSPSAAIHELFFVIQSVTL